MGFEGLMTRRRALLIGLVACGWAASAPPETAGPTRPWQGTGAALPESLRGEVAWEHIEAFSEGIGARVAGSDAERAAALYIEAAFRTAGYEPVLQPFSLPGRRAGDGLRSANVMAEKRGASSREIVVGAHYDSEARGRGADDNASGVGVLLEVAAALREVAVPYTLRFVAFGAEEGGLRGSRHFVSTMDPSAIQNTVAMINLDSLTAGDFAYVYGSEGDAGVIRDWILRVAGADGLGLRTQEGANPEYPSGTTCRCSDHAPFEEAGIQYAYFESTNWALGDGDGYTQVDTRYGEEGHIWHTPYDTLDYVARTFPGRIEQRLELFSRLLYRVLTEYEEGD